MRKASLLLLLIAALALLLSGAVVRAQDSDEDGGSVEGAEDDDARATASDVDEAGGDFASSGSDDHPNPVDSLVSQALNGEELTLPSGGDSGPTVAMGNVNRMVRDGVSEEDGEEDNSRESAIKKSSEESKKRAIRWEVKHNREEAAKERELLKQKESNEEGVKSEEDKLRDKTKSAVARGHEEQEKQAAQAKKQISAAAAERAAVLARMRKQEAKQRLELRVQEVKFKKRMAADRKKGVEGINKSNAAADKRKNDLANTVLKAKKERIVKRTKEQGQKRTAAAKRRAAEAKKRAAAKKRKEQANKKKEQAHKRRPINARHCDCHTRGINWWRNHQWKLCPNSYLLTGLHRNRHDNLGGITHYRCCRPCRQNRRLPVVNCRTANWGRSFDRRGWSHCPSNTFVQGFYKSSCNWIYCLEHARCCQVRGLKRRVSCGSRNWWGSLDRAGWSHLSGNRFMTGLYRNHGHWLHRIEMAYQCMFQA